MNNYCRLPLLIFTGVLLVASSQARAAESEVSSDLNCWNDQHSLQRHSRHLTQSIVLETQGADPYRLSLEQYLEPVTELPTLARAVVAQQEELDTDVSELNFDWRISIKTDENPPNEAPLDLEPLPVSNGRDYFHVNNLDYWIAVMNDGYEIVRAPTRWDKNDWLIAGAVVGATVALIYLVDDEVAEYFGKRKEDDKYETAIDIGEVFGEYTIMLPALAGTYLVGEFIEDPRIRRVGLIGAEAFIFSGLISNALKWSVGRVRPNETGDPQQFDGPGSGNKSFPSGHTTGAFSVASVIAYEYSEQPIVGIVAYVAAASTGFSRMANDKHWASDVFLGAAIGTTVGIFLSKLHENRRASDFQIIPFYDGRYAGVALSLKF